MEWFIDHFYVDIITHLDLGTTTMIKRKHYLSLHLLLKVDQSHALWAPSSPELNQSKRR